MSSGHVSCQANITCPLNETDGLYFTPDEWLRLAAPRPLPATVRAVLEATELYKNGEGPHPITSLLAAINRWIAAGRPGLEP
jgi:hypothetical protein